MLVANAVNSDNRSTRMGEWWKDRQYLLSSTWVELFLVNFSASIDLAICGIAELHHLEW